MVGQTFGHYRIVEEIGAGGMSVVYRAHDEQLDRDVALKILPAGLLADESARNRFRREALALAKLNHPNIETVYELGSAEHMDYLAMELIPGETLRAKLTRGRGCRDRNPRVRRHASRFRDRERGSSERF